MDWSPQCNDFLVRVSCDDDVGDVNIVELMLVMVIFKKTTESIIKKEDMAERKVLLGIFTLKQLCKNVNVVTVPFTRVDTYLGSMVLFACKSCLELNTASKKMIEHDWSRLFEEVITKTIEYHLFDVVVEFH
ncbi:hypothetical protein Tco_1340060, partial [Tanacetum coccineum]